jgi:hypothetical protein
MTRLSALLFYQRPVAVDRDAGGEYGMIYAHLLSLGNLLELLRRQPLAVAASTSSSLDPVEQLTASHTTH